MDAAARTLVGRHDFSAFGTPPHGENCVREMLRARVERQGSYIHIELEANAFLYRMVRRIAGTLISVGKGTMTIEEFGQVVTNKRRAGQSVPPQGLCLVTVKYDL
jgi:tRNA pseudouridine38-40 synthase